MTDNPYQSPQSDPEILVAKYSCPHCGNACEAGHVHALGAITWFPEMTSFKLSRPEKLSGKGLSLETRLKAFRCRDCDKIFVDIKTINSEG